MECYHCYSKRKQDSRSGSPSPNPITCDKPSRTRACTQCRSNKQTCTLDKPAAQVHRSKRPRRVSSRQEQQKRERGSEDSSEDEGDESKDVLESATPEDSAMARKLLRTWKSEYAELFDIPDFLKGAYTQLLLDIQKALRKYGSSSTSPLFLRRAAALETALLYPLNAEAQVIARVEALYQTAADGLVLVEAIANKSHAGQAGLAGRPEMQEASSKKRKTRSARGIAQ